MKRKIYSNGINIEIVYQTNEFQFGDKKYTTSRQLVLNVLEKDGNNYIPMTEYFNLNDYDDIFGNIYANGNEKLSIFRAFDEWIGGDITTVEVLKMTDAIAKFDIQLTEHLANEEFASKLKEVLVYTYEDA